MKVQIVSCKMKREVLIAIAQESFGDLVKAVVDVARGIMAIGGELHADEEAALLENGSAQEALWGINLYPAREDKDWIEFDSVINLRPNQGNRSRYVEDAKERERIAGVAQSLIE